MPLSTRTSRSLGAGVLYLACTANALADDAMQGRADALFDLSLSDLLNTSVSTGVRFGGHTVAESSLSLVSLSTDDLRAAHGGSNNLNMVLRDLVPSFNYLTEPLNDGSSHVRAFSLRGLPPDQTLVLLNGKRFHRSALIQLSVGSPVFLGSQSADLAQLPVFGLKRVEVLRDGASAQYGSDAIAGVINLILSDRAEGGEIQLQRGGTGAGDGGETRVSMNVGTRLGEQGFFSLTAEQLRKDATSRGQQRPDAAHYAEQGLAVANPAQIWGSPELAASRLLWNARLDLPHAAQAYMFGNFSTARSDASFNYRSLGRAFFTTNMNTANGSQIACPALPGDPYGYLGARNCLGMAQANPSLFNFQTWFPGGFTPRLAAHNKDASQVMGVKGTLASGASYDISLSAARDKIAYRLNQSINPSMGPASPTAFALGALTQTERNLHADLVWPISKQLSLAAGGEWRQEVYQSQAGEPASWLTGPYASLGIGANGMPGISPTAAGRFKRQNLSIYADSEYRPNENLLLSVAARAEHYSDFGNASNGKFSLRYLFNDKLTLRGALGSGFRAPSPGQSHLTNISHNAGSATARVQIAGIIPPTSAIARFFGAQPLQPERSRNVSLGMAYRDKALSLSLDAFRIGVADRIELSNGLSLTDALRTQMRAAGITDSDDYDSIVVFNNAADSVTQGVDVSGVFELDSTAGQTEFKANVSRVSTRAKPNDHGFPLGASTLHNLAHQMPKLRAGLSARHRAGAWRATVSTVLYGPFSVHDGATATPYPSKVLTNVELGYTPPSRKAWHLAAGLGNVFDTQAHRTDASIIGSTFISENPFEYEGRTFYLSAKYAF
jgi:iron complex outermembrane receptor protein